MNEPLVSIIIPVYNGGNYLRLALESALHQTYPNIEVIVVNDGSTDDGETERIALSFSSPKLKYIFKENGGTATSLNRGIQEAQGEYICWLSHDDLLAKDKIEMQVHYLSSLGESAKKTILYGKTILIDEHGNKHKFIRQILYRTPKKTFYIPSDYFKLGHIFYGSLLLPKAFFDDNPFLPELRYSQDVYSFFQMLTSGYTLRFVPNAKVYYRVHKEQGSFVRLNDYAVDCAYIYDKFTSYFKKSHDEVFIKRYLFHLARRGASYESDHQMMEKLIQEFPDELGEKAISKAHTIQKRYIRLYKIKKKIFSR